MNRFFAALIIVAATSSISACDSISRITDSSDGTTSVSGPVLRQSPRAIDEVVIGEDGRLHCKNGLQPIELPTFENHVDLGDSYVEIDRDLDDNSSYTIQYTFSGKPLNVKAAYVTTYYIGDAPDFPGPATESGVVEDRDKGRESVSITRDFTALWTPDMWEKGVAVLETDFGHGHNDILEIVLCVQP